MDWRPCAQDTRTMAEKTELGSLSAPICVARRSARASSRISKLNAFNAHEGGGNLPCFRGQNKRWRFRWGIRPRRGVEPEAFPLPAVLPESFALRLYEAWRAPKVEHRQLQPLHFPLLYAASRPVAEQSVLHSGACDVAGLRSQFKQISLKKQSVRKITAVDDTTKPPPPFPQSRRDESRDENGRRSSFQRVLIGIVN